MRTFKRIPLPGHEYMFLVHYSNTTSFKLKRNYSKISDTVYYTVEIGLDALQVIGEYMPDLWYDLEHGKGNAIDSLKRHGFIEVDATELEFKMYN